MSLSLYNSLGRELQSFVPLTSGKVGFYGCGPTVYDYAHIGNLRAYVFHDSLVRVLRRSGYALTYVMNITDVGHLSGDNDSGDDKMLRSAEARGKSVLDIARFYTDAFFHDTALLNIRRPDVVCQATEHIDDMIALIKRIESNGFTYSAGGNLYFDISKFPSYGALARLKLDDLKAEARVDVDPHKRNPFDFVLWFTKSKFSDQALVWDSPWGKGYPGWHIECSAMSIKYLGESFDIHAGGVDHIAVHHSNEIAQSEAATGKPWVRYWLHNEFLVLDKEKMSKSSGSFLTLSTLLEAGYDALDYRYFLLGGHYRSQLQFSYTAMDGARSARSGLVARLRQCAEKASRARELLNESQAIAERTRGLGKRGPASVYLDAFDTALDQDINTPRAIAELWNILRDPKLDPNETLETALEMDGVLGFGLASAVKASLIVEPELAAAVERLIAERDRAKRAKDYAAADAIREDLRKRGVILEDGPGGTVWRRA